MAAQNQAALTDEQKFLHIPYEQRWECLKDVIIGLFLGDAQSPKPMKLTELAKHMQETYSFSAEVHHFRHRLKKWDVRKRTVKPEKDAIITALGKRVRAGASIPGMAIDKAGVSTEVDVKQLKRYMKDQIRHRTIEPLTPGSFARWNLPYSAYLSSIVRRPDAPSPFGHNQSTPAYLNIQSPEVASPGGNHAGLSPGTTQLVQRQTLYDRSNLFLQGRHEDLLVKSNPEDRKIITDWFYDFWIHSFVTAKYWGKGPFHWTPELISIATQSPADVASPPIIQSPHSLRSGASPHSANRAIPRPTDLCQWAIHHEESVDYVPLPDPVAEQQDQFDMNQSSWTLWPESELQSRSIHETLRDDFLSGSFSTTPATEVPISGELIAKAIEKSPRELAVEACAFAIMAGNTDLLIQQSKSFQSAELFAGVMALYPLHLAAAYLNGGQTCCLLVDELATLIRPRRAVRFSEVDAMGHTILDSIFLSVIRSHTDLAPSEVSSALRHSECFPGEEKDICGRWDGDSPAIRRLYEHGRCRIPTEWKHPFCHSSTQAICHSITVVWDLSTAQPTDFLVSLFSRRCTDCGLELKLGSLHLVVVVAYYLATRGRPGETLFGILATLTCLLALGTDPSFSTPVSVHGLLGRDDGTDCDHTDINAAEMASQVPHSIINDWTPECRIGWRCLVLTLRHAVDWARRSDEPMNLEEGDMEPGDNVSSDDGSSNDGSSNDGSSNDGSSNDGSEAEALKAERAEPCQWLGFHKYIDLPCHVDDFGTLWACIQTEMLTYRRIASLDSWLSPNFSMDALASWIEGETSHFETPFVNDEMMKDHSKCGWFMFSDKRDYPAMWATADEVSSHYFMNMDVWSRSSFIDRPKT